MCIRDSCSRSLNLSPSSPHVAARQLARVLGWVERRSAPHEGQLAPEELRFDQERLQVVPRARRPDQQLAAEEQRCAEQLGPPAQELEQNVQLALAVPVSLEATVAHLLAESPSAESQ
eukprot:TRINITY_DN4440_c0_g1_i5.p1 TRINITY_DN4440_c0_g1~~TRINITY_DN4440_c0_g1_i5.p1  ORF type:complete len:138 (+),score=33.37 TRINITY_DN4440_c0_g1_i5:61-414(+)